MTEIKSETGDSEEYRLFVNNLLMGAFGLFDDGDDMGDSTQIEDLYLRRSNGGETWTVHQMVDGEIMMMQDIIRPQAFPSARVLAAYLRDLHSADPSRVDLPEEPERYTGPTVTEP